MAFSYASLACSLLGSTLNRGVGHFASSVMLPSPPGGGSCTCKSAYLSISTKVCRRPINTRYMCICGFARRLCIMVS